MKNKKRLALQVGLVAVIIYLWLNRSRKKRAIAKAKAGAEVVAGAVEGGIADAVSKVGAETKAVADLKPASDNYSSKLISSSPAQECGSPSNQPTKNLGKVEQTISITQSNANFSGSNSKGVKAQYFR